MSSREPFEDTSGLSVGKPNPPYRIPLNDRTDTEEISLPLDTNSGDIDEEIDTAEEPDLPVEEKYLYRERPHIKELLPNFISNALAVAVIQAILIALEIAGVLNLGQMLLASLVALLPSTYLVYRKFKMWHGTFHYVTRQGAGVERSSHLWLFILRDRDILIPAGSIRTRKQFKPTVAEKVFFKKAGSARVEVSGDGEPYFDKVNNVRDVERFIASIDALLPKR